MVVIALRVLPWLFVLFVRANVVHEEKRAWLVDEKGLSAARHPPEQAEASDILMSAWREVERVAALRPSAYRMLLRYSLERRAGAMPRRVIAVSAGVVRGDSVCLRAVLAHELGHHLLGGILYRSLDTLTAMPVRAVFGGPVDVLLDLSARARMSLPWAVALAGLVPAAFAAFVAAMAPAVGMPTATGLAAACLLHQLVQMQLHWSQEFFADRVAVELGYGFGLARYLSELPAECLPASLTHPSAAQRVRRIRDRMHALADVAREPISRSPSN
ncbi:M48 family metalloprotease [Nocardia sp. CDC159]|uniref:M48 family metalloprotease n=1 Tax=Nocardia pulmonis TaxID=2951408 RepID=A0A9X2E813_9NOCA|nr:MULTISPECIES: M48 family metalloprotease [Nocardia]MCM6775311.1 M48 family metalloprotease [Nocardia pulmonis]MCM6787955.1 M48 family metalloprotease [Nocardia sp. CDC159]